MSLTVQVVLTGLSAGGVYGLIAIGHTLIYRLTGIVHFALGDLVGLGAFTTLLVVAGTAPLTSESVSGPRMLLGVGVGFGVCLAAGIAGYLLVVQPYLAARSPIGWIAATLALGFAIRAALDAVFSRSAYVFPDPFPFRRLGNDGVVSVLGARVHVRAFAVLGVAVLLAAAASWALKSTRFGRGLRAVVADDDAAGMMGVDVERMRALAFGLAGGIAALAVVVAAPGAPFETGSGALLGLKGLVAAVIARFAGLWSAFAAGLALGVGEAAVGSGALDWIGLGADYREVVPIAIALALLALRPTFGRTAVE
ncbi:MAG: branched-chain amino acid ABC transporter permease [Actinomycetota bacterium]|nr:branched-chain amino acid ABC transporter permease [Actinomycetota bacterium]